MEVRVRKRRPYPDFGRMPFDCDDLPVSACMSRGQKNPAPLCLELLSNSHTSTALSAGNCRYFSQ